MAGSAVSQSTPKQAKRRKLNSSNFPTLWLHEPENTKANPEELA